ncbi:MAG: phosphatidate cytidylyltransferase [Anaerolineae bacterium]|nr:phosphatidate cytidylyltransferase [Anaerolineae bacterium]MCB0204516.1 phosphatidate cytidylyltransferase [Anaerolineae bacterium]MCB0253393.1 phosphatidate cytidylyltransferase [Anaerolineae bacterium]
MLRTRVISAIVLLAIVAIPLILGGLPFFVLVAAFGLIATYEFVILFRKGQHAPMLIVAAALTLAFIAQAQWPALLPLAPLLTAAVIASLIASLWNKSEHPASDWALTLAGALYVGWLLSNFVRLRAQDQGLYWVLLGALAIWTADATAYFSGRAYGKHPWWPRHSPKKTWEGYLTGAAAATVVTAVLGVLLLQLSPLEAAALGLLIGLAAPLGDLAESMIKREVGAKDSSNFIPGHGGFLDRLDSLLITIPIVYYWATVLPRWG